MVLEGAPVDEAGEAVGRRLELRLRHDAQHAEPGAGLVRERLQVVDPRVVEGRRRACRSCGCTPTVRPMIDIGTHTAEHRPCARPRSFGQASSASLSANRWVCARRAAGQCSGESTGQPGASPSATLDTTMRSRSAWLLSASSSSTGASGTTVAKARSIASCASGSPSAISSTLAQSGLELAPARLGRHLPFVRRALRALADGLVLRHPRDAPEQRSGEHHRDAGDDQRPDETFRVRRDARRRSGPRGGSSSATIEMPPTVEPRELRCTSSRAVSRSCSVTSTSGCSPMCPDPNPVGPRSGRSGVGDRWPSWMSASAGPGAT